MLRACKEPFFVLCGFFAGQVGVIARGAKCKMQNWGFIGEKLQRKDVFFFEKKNQKAFDQLRGKILRKLCCDKSQHITIFSLLAGSSKICNLLP